MKLAFKVVTPTATYNEVRVIAGDLIRYEELARGRGWPSALEWETNPSLSPAAAMAWCALTRTQAITQPLEEFMYSIEEITPVEVPEVDPTPMATPGV